MYETAVPEIHIPTDDRNARAWLDMPPAYIATGERWVGDALPGVFTWNEGRQRPEFDRHKVVEVTHTLFQEYAEVAHVHGPFDPSRAVLRRPAGFPTRSTDVPIVLDGTGRHIN